jgi:hypothetical protein
MLLLLDVNKKDVVFSLKVQLMVCPNNAILLAVDNSLVIDVANSVAVKFLVLIVKLTVLPLALISKKLLN